MLKSIFKICLLVLTLTSTSFAAPGDTTKIVLYKDKQLPYYGNYDTTVTLPTAKRYRKINLHYILGLYVCPGNPQYCGSWDYTTNFYVVNPSLGNIEIARVITPYATGWVNKNWSNDYVIDVTDYASILKGNTKFSYAFGGYSFGFKITMILEMIEGVPPMDALSVQNIYNGEFTYGHPNPSLSIESNLTPKIFANTNQGGITMVKHLITGHGNNGPQCSEFCKKYYDLKVNNNFVARQDIWKSDCGLNNIYPQTGTWLIDRANWCPGEAVRPFYHNITSNIGTAPTYTVDIDMEYYVESNQNAYYITRTHLINYSAPNHSLDVELSDIIAPNENQNYTRFNPICANPRVKIKNVGSALVTSVEIKYNLKGGQEYTTTWTGNLPFLKDTIVELGHNMPMMLANNSNSFIATVAKVNGNIDQNSLNNSYQVKFNKPVVYPTEFIVLFKANKASSPTRPGENETTWKIIDHDGNVVKSRTNAVNNIVYRDTVRLKWGCYTLIMDDEGCEGISWWANSSQVGSGIFRIDQINGGTLKTFNGDFGCQFTEAFTVQYNLGNENITQNFNNDFNIYPNPASTSVKFQTTNLNTSIQTIQISDITGKLIYYKVITTKQSEFELEIDNFVNGLYFITCSLSNGSKLTKKLNIQK